MALCFSGQISKAVADHTWNVFLLGCARLAVNCSMSTRSSSFIVRKLERLRSRIGVLKVGHCNRTLPIPVMSIDRLALTLQFFGRCGNAIGETVARNSRALADANRCERRQLTLLAVAENVFKMPSQALPRNANVPADNLVGKKLTIVRGGDERLGKSEWRARKWSCWELVALSVWLRCF